MHAPGTKLHRPIVGRTLDADGRLPTWIEEAIVIAPIDGIQRIRRADGHEGRLVGEWYASRLAAEKRRLELFADAIGKLLEQADDLQEQAGVAAVPARTLDGLMEMILGPLVGAPSGRGRQWSC